MISENNNFLRSLLIGVGIIDQVSKSAISYTKNKIKKKIICSDKDKDKVIYIKKENNLMNEKRPSWDEYFIGVVDSIAKRGTCNRGKSGAVIVKNNRIISAGYVGSPSGLDHCDDVGHELYQITKERKLNDNVFEFISKSTHCLRTIHAEANAIYNAAKNGVSLEGSTIYCTMVPCINCAYAIIQSGIKKVVCKYEYQKMDSVELFAKLGIEFVIINKEKINY